MLERSRFVVSEAVWEKVAPLLPGKPSDPGATARDNRLLIASVKVVEFAWVGEAAIGGQAALGGSRVGASSVGGISISAMASTCM